jgi:hypothetical protein
MKNINENVIDKMKKIVKDKQAMKIDGVLVDLYTASAVPRICKRPCDERTGRDSRIYNCVS